MHVNSKIASCKFQKLILHVHAFSKDFHDYNCLPVLYLAQMIQHVKKKKKKGGGGGSAVGNMSAFQ